ncbi:hypothetical protein HMPREF0290_0176 [Corynebacterium efficiens YS-314]|uniref:DUF2382 domain-containing protein n=1 Tax=Corynebacterium efficiens (strain DSM 44549 / YS-314 / AJ 12310 / JCM 11189 / NBRC 100395) TaxID=196164 RepID=Q8FM17_COREF|nr:PRC and DUF2382 domain-containing protein [Corynebacterium efficiens]EEW51216.1 hypothetical protein HMPREF0290_0176 [Corynebacterium efficiens YS-314]BAC19500.1 conserved hypothetical protein [Corynebacterium efficiens YS-314]
MVQRNIHDLANATAYDRNGDKLGSVKEVYINDASGQPDFVEVGHGLFGMSSSVVPLRGHQLAGEELRLAFTKDRISDAPDFNSDEHLSESDQQTIYRHYGLESTDNIETYESDIRDPQRDTAGLVGGGVGGGAGGAVHDRDHVDTVDAADAVTPHAADGGSITRSEERLNVDKQRVDAGQVRLRKYVVHDTETVEVPVQREEVRVERTPIDADSAAGHRGGDLHDEETSVTLSEERVVVNKETVPVEEVRLEKETVRDTEVVSEDVAREEIDVDGDVTRGRDGDTTLPPR